MPDRMILFRTVCALIAATAMMASDGSLPFLPSLVLAVGIAAAIYSGLWFIQNRVSPAARDYGYLAIGSVVLLFVLVVLPSRSGGLLMLGLISWAVITALVGALIYYYRKNPLH